MHEGPQRIGSPYNQYEEPLADGMFLSDEPGYYKAGDFGIRIEDDMEVVLTNRSANDNVQFLRFDTITHVPYEQSLINVDLLSAAHYNSINKYHEKVAKLLEPLLKGDPAALRALRYRTTKLNKPKQMVSTVNIINQVANIGTITLLAFSTAFSFLMCFLN